MRENKWICKNCKYRKTKFIPYREMCTAYITGKGHWRSCDTKKGKRIVCITFEPKRRKEGGEK